MTARIGFGRWRTPHTWLRHVRVLDVAREMRTAAWFTRLRPLAAELDPPALDACLVQTGGWSGAVVPAQDHLRAGPTAATARQRPAHPT